MKRLRDSDLEKKQYIRNPTIIDKILETNDLGRELLKITGTTTGIPKTLSGVDQKTKASLDRIYHKATSGTSSSCSFLTDDRKGCKNISINSPLDYACRDYCTMENQANEKWILDKIIEPWYSLTQNLQLHLLAQDALHAHDTHQQISCGTIDKPDLHLKFMNKILVTIYPDVVPSIWPISIRIEMKDHKLLLSAGDDDDQLGSHVLKVLNQLNWKSTKPDKSIDLDKKRLVRAVRLWLSWPGTSVIISPDVSLYNEYLFNNPWNCKGRNGLYRAYLQDLQGQSIKTRFPLQIYPTFEKYIMPEKNKQPEKFLQFVRWEI